LFDFVVQGKLKRGPQVVTLKDAAFVSAFTGLQSGDLVVDAGAGSGWLACYLGSIVAPSGKVFSYEVREEFALLAEENVKRAGLEGVVVVKRGNVFEEISEKNVDLVALDLAGSEKALSNAFAALRPGGKCVGYFPCFEQFKAFVLEGERIGFEHERTIEVGVREMLVRDYGCRPATKGLTHTGYLSFLCKPAGKE
jgi:tRNA (adenine57-N1/adenine58-N1)-methyltransferase